MNRRPLSSILTRLLAAAGLSLPLACNAVPEEDAAPGRAFASALGTEVEAVTWQPVGSMAHSRSSFAAVVLGNGRVLAAGGAPSQWTEPYPPAAELFNPATGTWSPGGNLGRGRQWLALTRLDSGKVLASGGETWAYPSGTATYYADAELYDPATNSWTPVAPMRLSRSEHTATLLRNGKVLVTGGWTDGGRGTCTAELYDPATNTWTSAGCMPHQDVNHTATLLADGKVLVAGGDVTEADLYDPATNSWLPGGQMTTRRTQASATLLADGKVLVAGGTSFGVAAYSSTELCNPNTSTLAPAAVSWTPAAPMAAARVGHGAVRVDGGKVLVAGGYVVGGSKLTSVELYNPATRAWTPGPPLTTARSRFPLLALPSGNVLAVGTGQTAEVYRANEERELGSATGTVATGSTCGAFSDFAPSCGGSNAASDLAFLWTAPKSGHFIFSTYGSTLDTVLEVRNASTGALMGCNDNDDSTPQSILWLQVTAGQRVRIVVDGRGTACGDFRLGIGESAWNPL